MNTTLHSASSHFTRGSEFSMSSHFTMDSKPQLPKRQASNSSSVCGGGKSKEERAQEIHNNEISSQQQQEQHGCHFALTRKPSYTSSSDLSPLTKQMTTLHNHSSRSLRMRKDRSSSERKLVCPSPLAYSRSKLGKSTRDRIESLAEQLSSKKAAPNHHQSSVATTATAGGGSGGSGNAAAEAAVAALQGSAPRRLGRRDNI